MEIVIGLCLLLLGVCHGMETYCDGRQNRAQCYGALGGSVVLRLMDNASDIYSYKWINSGKEILSGKRNRILSNLTGTRFSFTPSDGTVRINNLNRDDSGEYILESFDSHGKKLEPRTLQLLIQAPVSSALLVSECLSQGEMRVSCSSEGGDSPQYSWTLDGRSLTDAELLSRNNETTNITLKQNVSGRLVCSVKNHISNVSNGTMISSCGFIFINCTLDNATHAKWVLEANNTLCISTTTTAPTTNTTIGKTNTTVSSNNGTTPSQHAPSFSWYIIMAGVLITLVLLVLAGVAVIYLQKKKKDNKPKEETDEHELTYADVRVMQQQGRQVQPRADVDVEYGQVKFSGRPRQSVARTGDECVYAAVRKGR